MAQLLIKDILREARMSSLQRSQVISSMKRVALTIPVMIVAPVGGKSIDAVIEEVSVEMEEAEESLLNIRRNFYFLYEDM
ncbi:hypothetical protein Nepgr_006056 [Nepenthes gracilis]|uniref:Uncharacterized protein n=1 Tax=Nepenthes gracilis TaxID=150966 RepID=A0AAD3S4S8_NEPGR|nr:hypothetical protein Nepgr_006056 [Nepenthes gracilis]